MGVEAGEGEGEGEGVGIDSACLDAFTSADRMWCDVAVEQSAHTYKLM